MNSTTDILQTFDSVQLSQIDAVKLLNRVDTKFLVKATRLPELLECLRDDYLVLEINQVRMSNYKTVYFDTPDFFYYYQHQTGRLERLKIRLRTYLETNQSFIEIKVKNNHSKTTKKRIAIAGIEGMKDKKVQKLIKSKSDRFDEIIPVIEVYYSRITLVNKEFTERLTIDTGLNYKSDSASADFSGLCIMELKQDKSSKSALRELLREKRVFQTSLSKYCLGIASLYPEVKKNNIKEKMRFVNKLCCDNELPKTDWLTTDISSN